MDFKTKYEIEKNNGLVITPEGDSDYIFRGGSGYGFHSSGRAKYGIAIEYAPNGCGGVLLLDDIVRLRDFLNAHINRLQPKKWWQFWK